MNWLDSYRIKTCEQTWNVWMTLHSDGNFKKWKAKLGNGLSRAWLLSSECMNMACTKREEENKTDFCFKSLHWKWETIMRDRKKIWKISITPRRIVVSFRSFKQIAHICWFFRFTSFENGENKFFIRFLQSQEWN